MISPTALSELCRRVAAGDEQVRRDFDRRIAPLVEIVVRRWLRQQEQHHVRRGSATVQDPADAAIRSQDTAGTERVRQISGAICARVVRQFVISGHAATRCPNDTLVADNLCETIVGIAVPAFA